LVIFKHIKYLLWKDGKKAKNWSKKDFERLEYVSTNTQFTLISMSIDHNFPEACKLEDLNGMLPHWPTTLIKKTVD